MLLRSPSVTSLFHFSLQYVHWCFKQSDWFGILNYLSCELKMQWLHCGNNTVTTCPSQVIAFWKCQSCLLPLPHPPPQKKIHSHSLQFLPGGAVVTRDIKDSAQAILGWGGGRIEGWHKQGQEIQKWWIVLFPSFIFFVLFSWPHKLNGQIQNQQAHDI